MPRSSRRQFFTSLGLVGVRDSACQIRSGYFFHISLTTFSENRWDMRYGGWSLFFAAEVLNGLTNLVADWPADLDAGERYRRAIDFLDGIAREPTQRVFPD